MNRAQAKQLVTECLVDAGELAVAITEIKHLTQVTTMLTIADLLLCARLESKEGVPMGSDFKPKVPL